MAVSREKVEARILGGNYTISSSHTSLYTHSPQGKTSAFYFILFYFIAKRLLLSHLWDDSSGARFRSTEYMRVELTFLVFFGWWGWGWGWDGSFVAVLNKCKRMFLWCTFSEGAKWMYGDFQCYVLRGGMKQVYGYFLC